MSAQLLKPLLKLMNGYILVEFEEKKHIVNGTELIIPERYLIQDGDEDSNSAWGVTTDRRLINPQVVKVIQGEGLEGKRCFVHYGAYEIAKWHTETLALIPVKTLLFSLDPITPFDGNYLGEEIWVDGVKTASGIYTTPYAEKKEACNIKIVHTPENSSIKAGDEIITIDDKQYPLKYDDKTFIKVKESEIIGLVKEGVTVPYGKYLLAEYVEEEDKNLIAHNEYKAHLKDVAIKFGIHCPDMDYNPSGPASKVVEARILGIGDEVRKIDINYACVGDMILVARDRGALLSDGKWIINLDAFLCSKELIYGEAKTS